MTSNFVRNAVSSEEIGECNFSRNFIRPEPERRTDEQATPGRLLSAVERLHFFDNFKAKKSVGATGVITHETHSSTKPGPPPALDKHEWDALVRRVMA